MTVIKGWTEAMQLMVEGDKWEMYIPSELGYGDRGSPPKIGGGDVLVFTSLLSPFSNDGWSSHLPFLPRTHLPVVDVRAHLMVC